LHTQVKHTKHTLSNSIIASISGARQAHLTRIFAQHDTTDYLCIYCDMGLAAWNKLDSDDDDDTVGSKQDLSDVSRRLRPVLS